MNDPDEILTRFQNRFRAIEAEIPERPFEVAPGRPRPRLRVALTSVPFGAALVLLVTLVVVPQALRPSGGAAMPPAAGTPAGESAVAPPASAAQSESPAVTVRPEPIVACGRLNPETCKHSIELVREAHPEEVAAAWAIVVDDICDPGWVCDRLHSFMSAVVLVPEPGTSDRPRSYLVVGEDYTPERILGPAEPLPGHIVALIDSLP